jgi:hypothetical protein
MLSKLLIVVDDTMGAKIRRKKGSAKHSLIFSPYMVTIAE